MSSLVQTPRFKLGYGKTDITAEITPFLVSLSYTDNLSDQSDELEVMLEDEAMRWIKGWFPTQGDALHLALGYQGEPLVNLGAFEIDEIEWQKSPASGSVVTLRALSTGISKASRTLKPKAYEHTTLAEIVRLVAKHLHLSVTGTIADIPIQRVTQYQERDVEFLTRLAHEYNHSFKIVGETLVFTTMASLQQRAPVVTLDLTQVKSIRLRDRIKDAVKKVQAVGFNAGQKQALNAQNEAKPKRPHKKRVRASNADTLKIVTRGESQAQIEARAEAALAQHNDDQQAGTLSLIGNPKLVAGNTLLLTGLGMFNGKYLIKSARHSYSRTQGLTTELAIRMLEFKDDETTTNA